MPPPHSAGILLFRQREGAIEVLLIRPGGPFWRNKDAGAWMIPKGAIEQGETPAEAALREFEEETGTRLTAVPFPLATVRQAGGKMGRGLRGRGRPRRRPRSARTSSRSNGRRAAGGVERFPKSPRRAG